MAVFLVQNHTEIKYNIASERLICVWLASIISILDIGRS